MSHKLHGYKYDPEAKDWVRTHIIPEGYLDPTCEDCQHKVIGNLVGEHFLKVVGMPRAKFDAMVYSFPRGVVDQIGNLPALEIMERRLYSVAKLESEPLDQDDQAFADYYALRQWEPLYAETEKEEVNA